MRRKQLLELLDKMTKNFTKDISSTTSGDKLINAGINVLILEKFSSYLKEEKNFSLKVDDDEFAKSFAEVLNDVSIEYMAYIKQHIDLESSTGLDILKEEINKTRNKNKGETDNV